MRVNRFFRGLVNDDGKPYQQKTVRYDIDGDGKKKLFMQDMMNWGPDIQDM